LGSVRIDGQVYSAVLEETVPLEQEPTWAGTRVIPEDPFAAPESSAVSIAPFNLETDVRTNPVLIGALNS